MTLKLKKIQLSNEQKALLEELTQTKIYLRNVSRNNQQQINQLLQYGEQNASIYLERKRLGQKLSIFEENSLYKTILTLQEKLTLSKIPRRIECYDISHLSGKFCYGSMVVFIDGVPTKKYYRLFKVTEQNNDFDNHKQVLSRRFQRALDFYSSQLENPQSIKPQDRAWELPDLIIVDGGKGQLSSDEQVLTSFRDQFQTKNIAFEVEICALAKRLEEIFLPELKNSVILEGEAQFLVQRIRDEAHRFAITNNRKARLKLANQSKLDHIKGIGPLTKNKLLSAFGSTEHIVDTLIKNPELVQELVGNKVTSTLKQHFLV